MHPLRITATLQTGVVSDAALPLDGLLFAAAMRAHHGPEVATLPGQMMAEPVFLPLARINAKSAEWCYACSWATWTPTVAEGVQHWTKRFDADATALLDWSRVRGRVNTGSGRYRGYHMPVYYRHALTVTWYAVGDGDAVRRLLADVRSVGKKRDQGWGAIGVWTIAPWAHDWSVECNGRLMRGIPVSHGARDEGRLHCGYRPSYWDRANQAECYVPPIGVRVAT